jgi:hypothetical protein
VRQRDSESREVHVANPTLGRVVLVVLVVIVVLGAFAALHTVA